MQERIRQLRNQLDEMTGGELIFGEGEQEKALPEVELEFLEQVIGFETAPMTTWREKLSEAGYRMPSPETLNDDQVGLEVWQVIQRLSELHAYIDSTNHLSDRELYEKLWEHLNEPVPDLTMGENAACHLEILAAGEEKDDQIWLMYYADDQDRQHWEQEFGVDLPPKCTPPYDRDRLLPRREFQ